MYLKRPLISQIRKNPKHDSAIDGRLHTVELNPQFARWFDMGVHLLVTCSTEHGMHTRHRREAGNANEYKKRNGAESQGIEAQPNEAQ